MARIEVSPAGPDTYTVTVTDAGGRSRHRVRVDAEALARYGGGADASELLVASFEFLLAREGKESILASFELPVIERYFPEYGQKFPGSLGHEP
jgi:hypothetical protein